MSLPRFALERPVVVGAFVTIAFIIGVWQFATMPRRADPDFIVRTCTVATRWPGIQAERVERLVTSPLEEALSSLEAVDYVESTTTTGLSVIYVFLPDSLPSAVIQQTWDKVRAKVALVEPLLPAGTSDPVVDDEFGDASILLLAIHERDVSDDVGEYAPRELETIAERVRERLSLMPGVARAELHGVAREAIYVECDPARWGSVDLTLADLRSILEARNIRVAGGAVETPDARVGIQPAGEFNLVSEISSVIVGRSRSGNPVDLEDLGFRVRRAYEDPPSTEVRYGDRAGSTPAIICSVVMQDGFKVTDLGPAVVETVERMQAVERTVPEDVAVDVVFDESVFVDEKISSFVLNVLQAVVIVVAVAVLMAGLRAAMVMAAAIPFVMVISIGISSGLGIELEQMSIASLIIALGMLVDNAVVVTDNARRYMDEGLSRTSAVVTGVEQILRPTLIGTLTTVCAFAPLAFFLTGARREYVLSIPVVVCVTLLTSWVLGMTLTALMARWIIRPSAERRAPLGAIAQRLASLGRRGHEHKGDGLAGLYGRLLQRMLAMKVVVLAVAAGLVVAAASLPVSSAFFPDDLRDYCYVDVWLAEGVSLEQTRRAATRVEHLLRELSPVRDDDGNEIERLERFYTSVGGSGPRFALGVNPTPPASNFAQIIVKTTDPSITEDYVQDIRQRAAARMPGVRVLPKRLALGPPVESPIGIRILARGFADPGFASEAALRREAARLADVFLATEGLWDVDQSWGRQAYQVDVDIDENEAKLAGVTNASIAEALSAAFSGYELTRFRDGDKQIPVYFRLPPERRTLDDAARSLFVEGGREKVQLEAVADLSLRRTTPRIERRRRNRMIEVSAKVLPGYLANERLNAIQPRIDAFEASLPPGMWLETAGTMEKSAEAQGEMMVALGVGVLLIIIVLIVQYNGLVKPLVVLTTVPMGIVGALFGLWVTGNALGFMPLLGLVSLAGIVVNSAVIYLEFADAMIAERRDDPRCRPAAGERGCAGLTRDAFRDALAEAGRLRLPAILLTVATTIGGLIPLALFGGPLWEGMAWLLIFGLAIATGLTLLVLPVIYAFLVEVLRLEPSPAAAPEPGARGT